MPIVSMTACQEREAQLRAYAISARDEHRVGDAGGAQTKEAAERSDLREDAGRERPARQRADAAYDVVAGLDVDPGLLVVHQNSSVWMSASAIFWRAH